MKYLIGAAVIVVIGLAVWGVAWLIQDQTQMCQRWVQAVQGVSQQDPKDLSVVLSMYAEDCDG